MALTALLSFATFAGWALFIVRERRYRQTQQELDRLTRAADEIDEGIEPRKPVVTFKVDSGETVIRSIGRYRNPARRKP